MADALIPGVTTQSVTSTVSSATTVVLWIFFVLLIAAALWFVFYFLSFKKRVIIIEEVNNGVLIHSPDRARVRKSKSGVVTWKLFFTNIVMSKPPGESVCYDNKGRQLAVAYLKEDSVIWTQVNILSNFNEKRLKAIDFDPFRGEDKATLAHEYRQADEYKTKKFADLLMQYGSLIGIVIIITILLIFGGDFYKSVSQPAISMGQTLSVVSDKLDVVVQHLDAVINNKQIILVNSNSTGPPN